MHQFKKHEYAFEIETFISKPSSILEVDFLTLQIYNQT